MRIISGSQVLLIFYIKLFDKRSHVRSIWCIYWLEEFTKIKTAKKITIYIITSSVDPADVLRAKQYDNVNNYIVKPITLEVLKELLVQGQA